MDSRLVEGDIQRIVAEDSYFDREAFDSGRAVLGVGMVAESQQVWLVVVEEVFPFSRRQEEVPLP